MQEQPGGQTYYTVGELAKLYNIPISTLRFYDNHGIFSPQLRDPKNNYRYYASEQLLQLDIILLLRELDMPTSKIPELLKHSSCRADLLGAIKNHRETVANEIQRLSLILEKIDSITDTFAGFDTTTGKLEVKSIDARLAIYQDASYIVTDPTVGRYSFKNRMSNFALSKGNPANVVAFGTTSSLADFIASDTIRYKYQFAQLKHWEDLGSTPIMDIPAGDYLTIRFENQREARLSAYYRLVEHIVDNHLDTDDTFYEGIVGCGMPPVNEAEDIVELQIRLN